MLKTFTPQPNKYVSFSSHTLLWIRSGQGLIEVDFKTYSEFKGRLIFLSPGQYIKFLFGEFEVARMEFSEEYVKRSPDYRVLFKHLISLGYIEFEEGDQRIFNALCKESPLNLLDLSTHQWFWQNPFKAEREEYTLIFGLKDAIDQHFRDNLSVEQLASSIHHDHYALHRLVKNRLGLAIKNLAQNKLLLESQKDIAFTDKPIQEVAYDLGFRDPAYFNRFFKQRTRHTPLEFRNEFGDEAIDTFLQDLLQLIQEHHHEQHSPAFYADKLHMSIKTLSRKTRNRLNQSTGALIRREVLQSAKTLLPHLPVKEVAYELGFREASHFSAYFKKYTGSSPTEFQSVNQN